MLMQPLLAPGFEPAEPQRTRGRYRGRSINPRSVMICTSLIFVSSDGMAQSREARTSAAVTLPCLPPKCPMT